MAKKAGVERGSFQVPERLYMHIRHLMDKIPLTDRY